MKFHRHNILPIPRKLFRFIESQGKIDSRTREEAAAKLKEKLARDKIASRQWTRDQLDKQFTKITANNKNASEADETPGNAIDLANDMKEVLFFYNEEAKQIKKIEWEPDICITPQARTYLLWKCLEHHLTNNDFIIMHDPDNTSTNGWFTIKDVSSPPTEARQQEAIKMMETIALFEEKNHILKSQDNIPTYLTYLTASAYHDTRKGGWDLPSHISTIEKKISQNINHSPITEEDIFDSDATAHEKTMYLWWIHRESNKEEIRKINEWQKDFVAEIKNNFDQKNPEKTREYIENHPFSAFAWMAVPGLITWAGVLYGLNLLFKKEGILNKIWGWLLLMLFWPGLARMLDRWYQAVGGADILNTTPTSIADAKDNPIDNTIWWVANIPERIKNWIDNIKSKQEQPDNFITAIMDPDIHDLIENYPMEHILYSTQTNFTGSPWLSVNASEKTAINNKYNNLSSLQKNKLTALIECTLREVKSDTSYSETDIPDLHFSNAKNTIINFVEKKKDGIRNTVFDAQKSWDAFAIIMVDSLNWGNVTLGQIYEGFLQTNPKLEWAWGEINVWSNTISVSFENFTKLREYFKEIFSPPYEKTNSADPNWTKINNYDKNKTLKKLLQIPE